jgi:hypothetical protein
MGASSFTITLPDEAVPVAKYLRSQGKFSETVAQFLIGYGARHNIK